MFLVRIQNRLKNGTPFMPLLFDDPMGTIVMKIDAHCISYFSNLQY